MIEVFFGLVSSYGLIVVFLSAYASCLGVPVPTFAVMLAGGAFAASGDFVLWQVWAVAYVAAVSGDQTGFQLGRWGGARLVTALRHRTGKDKLIGRAEAYVDQWGGWGVFFTTWAVAPLGPWVNLIAGAAGLSPFRFLAWDALGEAIWVTVYVLLGYNFGAQLGTLAEIVNNYAGVITAAAVALILAVILIRRIAQDRKVPR